MNRESSLISTVKVPGVSVIEFARAKRPIFDLSRQLGVELPILEQVYKIIYMDKSCSDAVKDLLARGLKAE